MLSEMAIENLGVIEKADLELAPGLTVLTGETGAGKTMVVTGLRLLIGGRADASRVRTGTPAATVEGAFSLEGLDAEAAASVEEVLSETGALADDNGEYIISRTVKSTGRSRAHLGGRSVPAASLAQFTEDLLTIHGQNDQLRLLSPERQLEALDGFDPQIAPLKASYQEVYTTWYRQARDYSRRVKSRRELAQEMDRLRFALNEIEATRPQPGEDREIIERIRRLQDVDTLREAATLALSAIDGTEALGGYGDETAASDAVGQAASALGHTTDSALKDLAVRLNQISAELADISSELGAYLSELPADPGQLEELLQRQQELKGLMRKYAPDIDGVLQWRDDAAARLDSIDVSEDALEALKREVHDSEKKMVAAAKKLSKARHRAAEDLAKEVTAEIHGLAMPKARLDVVVTTQKPGPHGIDAVELRLAPTPKAPSQPLVSAASGGELSRVMLGLEVIVARGSSGTTLVFDEVDAGVGGQAAVEIGRRLARLATKHQVIVVTHLPQVAAFADTHWHVEKSTSDDEVISGVVRLDRDARMAELSRMLAGLDNTESGRAHAREILELAEREKSDFFSVATASQRSQ